jgi:hypothetical protein
MNVEATFYTETPAEIHRTPWRDIPEDRTTAVRASNPISQNDLVESRRLRLVGPAIFVTQKRHAYRQNLKEGDVSVDSLIALKCMSNKYCGRMQSGLSCLGQGPVASSCEHRNDPSFSIKCCEFLDYLSNH